MITVKYASSSNRGGGRKYNGGRRQGSNSGNYGQGYRGNGRSCGGQNSLTGRGSGYSSDKLQC